MLTNPYVDPRCTHTTANGSRCRMLCMNDKSSLCQMHFDQQRRFEEDDLAAGQLLGPVEDLQTPAQINDALRRLFQVLARQRIPPRNAAILAYICQLLLTSLSVMERQNLRAETAPAVKQILARILKSPLLDAAAPSSDDSEGAPASSQPQEPGSQDTPSDANITIANY